MADIMSFPESWTEFLHDHTTRDGLVPSDKVEWMVEHYFENQRPATNYERIRAMDAKQLAVFLNGTCAFTKEMNGCANGRVYMPCLPEQDGYMVAVTDVYKWLNEPAGGNAR